MYSSPRLIVALDFPQRETALAAARQLDPRLCRLKVGKELFTRCGPSVLEDLHDLGFDVFLDLKFHDIPETVKKACRAAAELGVWMVNVHALGGARMMGAAREGVDGVVRPPILLGVTILTSMGESDLAEIGLGGNAFDHVMRLAALACSAGLDGVVCSAHEASLVRDRVGANFLRVTPGIRPASASRDDQVRVMTPAQALAAGASYLVVGRPITHAIDPAVALASIVAEMSQSEGTP